MKKKVITLLVILVALSAIVLGAGTQIWTTDADGQPQSDYPPHTLVYIQGKGFLPLRMVFVKVTRPDASIQSGFTTTNSAGEFTYVYDLDGIDGGPEEPADRSHAEDQDQCQEVGKIVVPGHLQMYYPEQG